MKYYLYMALLFLGVFMTPTTGFAQLSPYLNLPSDPNLPQKTFPFEQKISACLNNSPDPTLSKDAWKDKYSARLVYCMRILLEDSTRAFIANMVDKYAMAVVSAVVIFAFTLFGIKVIGGTLASKTKQEAFSLLMKTGFILFIISACRNPTDNIIVNFWFGATDMMTQWIAGAAEAGLNKTSFCPTASHNLGQWFSVWDRFDCLFNKFMGTGQATAIGTGFIAIIAAVIGSGGLGIWLAFVAFGAIIGLAQFLFRSATTVVLAYGGLALLLVLLPLFLPLILFKATESFLWDCWLRYATGYVLQPAITIGFLIFSLAIFDEVMMKGSPNTYVVYSPTKNEAQPITLQPGQKPPAGAERAIVTPAEILGFNYTDSKEKQREDVSGRYRYDKTVNQAKLSPDATSYSYMNNDCGTAGIANPSKDKVAGAENICLDKKKCAEAALSNFQKAPSANTMLALKKAACEYRKSGEYALDKSGSDLANNSFDMGGAESFQLELNRQNTPDGLVPAGQTPSTENLHDKRMMQLVGYVGAIILLSKTFLAFIQLVPGMVQSICGVPGQKLPLGSIQIGGKTLGKRLGSALESSEKSWRAALKNKNSSTLDRAGLQAIMGFGRGFIRGETFSELSQQKTVLRGKK